MAALQLAPRANWVQKTRRVVIRVVTRVVTRVMARVVATVSGRSPVVVALKVD